MKLEKKSLLSLVFILFSISLHAQKQAPKEIQILLEKNECWACHRVDTKLVGPSFELIKKSKKYSVQKIISLIYSPIPSNWPDYPPMMPQTHVSKDDVKEIANWIINKKTKK
jgi:cytochrome c